MRDKILLKILAILVAVVIVTSCIAPCIAVYNHPTNNASSNRTEEFNATVTPTPSPFYAKQFPLNDTIILAHYHRHKLFDQEMPMNGDRFLDPLGRGEHFNCTEDHLGYIPEKNLQQILGKFDQNASHSNISLSSNTHYVNPGESIQAAVDAAAPGDTIIVRDATYTENINVNKQLTIQSENGYENCVVQAANSDDDVFEVTADYVNIIGFTIEGATWEWRSGIDLSSSSYQCVISNNFVSNNYYGIISCSLSHTITNNVFENDGIFIWGSHLNHYKTHVIENNTINGKPIYYYKNTNGIKVPENAGEVILANCTDMIIENINASFGTVGIELAYTTYSEVSENNINSNNDRGIYLYFSSNNIITNNNASSNYIGISLYVSSNNIFTDNTVNSNNHSGITLGGHSDNNTLINNIANSNNKNGVILGDYCDNNTLINNTANSNKHTGIHSYSNKNTITNNIANSNKYDGILLSGSSNTLTNNTVNSNGYCGIILSSSDNNILTKNRMSGNKYNLAISGGIHNIDTSNKVDGKPVYYWVDQQNQQIPNDAGFVGIVNSTNITVSDLTLTNNSAGVLLAYSSNSTIENVNASNNIYGIRLIDSDSNILSNNTVSKNYYGVLLASSVNNSIYHNNCFNNTVQAQDNTGTNLWDNGYPSSGNHWSDYNGSDNFSGPYQNITGSDGIGDTPYSISGGAGAKDNYPLMEPWGGEQLPDLTLQPQDIVFLNETEAKIINVTIHNIGNADANNVVVQFFDGSPSVDGTQQLGSNQTIDLIAAGGTGSAQVSLPTAVEVHDIWIVIDPEDKIPENNEDNNMVYVHVIGLDVSSLYSTFYRYTNEKVNGDDPVIITTLAYSKLNNALIPLDSTMIHADIIDEFDNTVGVIEGKTDFRGLAHLGLDYLDEGSYDIHVRAYDNQNNHVSPLEIKRISIIESNLDLHLDMTPLNSYKEEFDLYGDGYPDYYINKFNDGAKGELSIFTDIDLNDLKLLIDPMSYYTLPDFITTPDNNIGDIPANSEKVVMFTLGTINGERYALVEAQGGDKSFLHRYATKVTPVIYLLFKDGEGKIHKILYQNVDKGRSFVFSYDRSGVSADVVTYAHGHLDEISAFVVEGVSEEYKELAVSTGYLRKAGMEIKILNSAQNLLKFASLVSELDKTYDLLQEPPSEARQISGVARWAGVSSSAVKLIGGITSLALPPAWLLMGANIATLGLDLLADHVEKEHLNFEQLIEYDMKTLPINVIDNRVDKDVVMIFKKWKPDIWPYYCLEAQFLNTQIEDKKVKGELKLLDNGIIKKSKEFSFDLPYGAYNPLDDYDNIPKVCASPWDSFIFRYYIENPDETREVSTYIENGVGLYDLDIVDQEGKRMFTFYPGDEIRLKLILLNLLDFDVLGAKFRVLVVNPEGEVIFDKFEENYRLGSKGSDEVSIPLKLPENAMSGKYTIRFHISDQNHPSKVYDTCHYYYQFWVKEGVKESHQIFQHGSIAVEVNLTDNFGIPIADANITARIEKPTGIIETLALSGNENGTYSILYHNDTEFGPYHISLLIDRAEYAKYIKEIFNKQNTSSVIFSNISLPSIMWVNLTYPLEGYVKNNGTKPTDAVKIVIDTSQDVKFNSNLSSSYTIPFGNLSIGEERSFNVNLTPSKAEKLYLRFKVMNESNTINEYLETVNVEQIKHKISLSSSFDSIMVWQGENATYTIFISNRGNVRENVTINVTVPNGWNYMLSEKNIQVKPNFVNNTRLVVIPPSFPSSGEINVTASSDIGIDYTIQLQCYVVPLIPVIEISPDIMDVVAYPNQTVILNYTVMEIANKSSATGLCVNISELKSENNSIGHECFDYSNETFNLTKGGSKNISITLHVPQIIQPGVYKGIIDVYGNNTGGDCAVVQVTIQPSIFGFDTGKGTYPSIMGTHKGEIKPSDNLSVSKLYTYPCPGTGGHTEAIEISENGELIANGSWNGYKGDWHNITIHNVTNGAPYVMLLKGHKYNYTIITGSYPQIIHEHEYKNATGGTITCTSFIDANGKVYYDWIPAIRLE